MLLAMLACINADKNNNAYNNVNKMLLKLIATCLLLSMIV